MEIDRFAVGDLASSIAKDSMAVMGSPKTVRWRVMAGRTGNVDLDSRHSNAVCRACFSSVIGAEQATCRKKLGQEWGGLRLSVKLLQPRACAPAWARLASSAYFCNQKAGSTYKEA